MTTPQPSTELEQLRERVRLLEQEQKAALQLQLQLFPRKPLHSGDYAIEHCIYPSGFVSGDFVEYTEFNDDILCFYLADVSGHGIASAFVTALLKHLSLNVLRTSREAIAQHQHNPFSMPADVVEYVNREMILMGLDKQATFFMGIIVKSMNTLFYSTAGHVPLPVLASADGVRFLEGGGLPVALMEDATYQTRTVKLPPVFSLLLFSDGVLEILPPGKLLEREAQLLALVADGNNNVPALVKRLQLVQGVTLPDDVTILTVTKSASA